jgi:type IV pilus assembly protein PilW
MSSRVPSTKRQSGFTLIELMIGVLIGLMASLAVTHVLVNSEGQKRTTTSGSDAQVNGALALATLQRALQPAGYGFTTTPNVIGCTLTAVFGGAAVADFPTHLVPISITDGASGAPDSIRILASGKNSYSVPLRITAPGNTTTNYPVGSVGGITAGDLVIAANAISGAPSVPCRVLQVTATPITLPEVVHGPASGWNAGPPAAGVYPDGGALINMGTPMDVTYSITGGALTVRSLTLDDTTSEPDYGAATELFPNIVQLQALYGKDTNADGNGKVDSVDTWDNVTPTTLAQWQQVIAVRIAVVARNSQYEKEDVTNANVAWDVGNAGTVAGSAACVTTSGVASKCLTIKIDDLGDDWKRYRYRLFETIVPLRNMLWTS